jgi:pimeloyl-ACP methyl ester carboxylesterase
MTSRLWITLVLLASIPPLATRPPQTRSLPRFEPAPCPAQVARDEKIDCGMLTVPENRHKPGSRSIRLPVMIFRSRAARPAPDPLVFMPGGPGGTSVADRRSGKNIPFLDERDYILLEPRGAHNAQPALECPERTRISGEIAAGRLRGAAAEEARVQAAAACRVALIASGADLDGYTTEAIADDLEDLRRALGYDAWNLQSISYSTRLMLTVLRKQPAGVRSVILDSVLPPEVNFDEVSAINVIRALNLVFDGCAVDRACGAAYPDLRKTFADLVARADRSLLPVAVEDGTAARGRVEVRGAQVVDAIYSALHDVNAIPRIPRIISEAAAGRYTELAPLIKGNQGPSSYAWGMRYSVWCADEAPFEDPARVASQVSRALGLAGIDEGAATPRECKAWNVTPSPAVENQPVTSSVPALIFAGEFDPDTPPQWGRQLLDHLSKAYYVEMRGRSHGASFNACGLQITTAFLRDPSSPPPVGCALTLRGADFSQSASAPR